MPGWDGRFDTVDCAVFCGEEVVMARGKTDAAELIGQVDAGDAVVCWWAGGLVLNLLNLWHGWVDVSAWVLIHVLLRVLVAKLLRNGILHAWDLDLRSVPTGAGWWWAYVDAVEGVPALIACHCGVWKNFGLGLADVVEELSSDGEN